MFRGYNLKQKEVVNIKTAERREKGAVWQGFSEGVNLSFRGALLRWSGKIWFLCDFLILIMKNYLEKNYRIVYNNTINTIHKGETQMRCPYCGFAESKVIDSRPTEESNSIRRRRECLKCQKRFTTY